MSLRGPLNSIPGFPIKTTVLFKGSLEATEGFWNTCGYSAGFYLPAELLWKAGDGGNSSGVRKWQRQQRLGLLFPLSSAGLLLSYMR